jgi:hypothetical protein
MYKNSKHSETRKKISFFEMLFKVSEMKPLYFSHIEFFMLGFFCGIICNTKDVLTELFTFVAGVSLAIDLDS